MAEKEISINFSTAKKMLIATGMRASRETVVLFQKKINKFMTEKALAASKNTEARHAKTIFPEDLERVFE